MGLPKLTILDVGHGQCVVLQHDEGVLLFDAGKGPILSKFLTDNAITEVDAVIVSHADVDHIAGLINLLLDESVTVGKVYLNPDASKSTEAWMQLRMAVSDAMLRGTLPRVGITSATTEDEFKRGDVEVEVLAPSPALALGGAGGKDLKGRPLTSNSTSVVTRVSYLASPFALLAGDLDGVGLDNLLEGHPSISAPVLVFPHHGGYPGTADPKVFADKLCGAVQPNVVIFSNGRGSHGTPRPEIVAAIRELLGEVQIACTQLSEHCAKVLPTSRAGHLSSVVASGSTRNACCAGSLQLTFDGVELYRSPEVADHLVFIASNAATALCRTPL